MWIDLYVCLISKHYISPEEKLMSILINQTTINDNKVTVGLEKHIKLETKVSIKFLRSYLSRRVIDKMSVINFLNGLATYLCQISWKSEKVNYLFGMEWSYGKNFIW